MSVRRLASDDTQPSTFAFTAENETWAQGQIAKFPAGRQMSAVIPLLWRAQEQAGGWLPQKAMEFVADRLGMAYIRVLEVATFYTMFNLEPVGRHFVQLCGTVPCHVKGAIELKDTLRRRIGEERHVSPDGLFSWLEVECLGACCNAPMVQINADYFEDLTPESLGKILDDLAGGRAVKPGPQNGRVSSEPKDEVKTLTDPALFDGSLIGAWRKRFEEEGVKEIETRGAVEAATLAQRGAENPRAAKPDSGRAVTRAIETPANRAAEGKDPPVDPKDRADAGAPERATAVEPRTDDKVKPSPQSDKSYTATPSKPAQGRVVADAKGTTPVSGTPQSDAPTRRDGSDTKPPGTEIRPEPGVAPTERK